MSGLIKEIEMTVGRWGIGALVAVMLVNIAACDKLLEVDLPDAVTSEALDSPSTAAVQLSSVITLVECAYSGLAIDAGGYEDVFQRVSGVAGLYSEYETTPGDACQGDAYSSGWNDELFLARGQGYDTYERLNNWTNEEISAANGLDVWANREQMLATAALYNAIIVDMLGEFHCEVAIDSSPLMSPSETMSEAEAWATTALEHIDAAGDFQLVLAEGTVTNSMETLAYGIRARIRWSNGDLDGAADDAAQVPDGFAAWILREAGAVSSRWNLVVSMQGGIERGNISAAGFVQGPVQVFQEGDPYGVTLLGSKPGGGAWPDPVPFTGYLDLGIIELTGRAVYDDGTPVLATDAGAVADVRVEVGKESPSGDDYDHIPLKYDGLGSDIPLLNWMEMRLIRAEAEGGAAAVAHVNAVRSAAAFGSGRGVWNDAFDLPDVSYVNTADPDAVEDMILEERRRALWLEGGRYWSTKIQNTDKLWFPRNHGSWQNQSTYALEGGVRVLMPEDEYTVNPAIADAGGLDLRGTGCSADQAPIFLSE